MISELVTALIARSIPIGAEPYIYKASLHNTAWCRVSVTLRSKSGPLPPAIEDPEVVFSSESAINGEQNTGDDLVQESMVHPPSHKLQSAWKNRAAPDLIVRVTHSNQHAHLSNVVRQKGGIGSAAHDPNQTKIDSYFKGEGR